MGVMVLKKFPRPLYPRVFVKLNSICIACQVVHENDVNARLSATIVQLLDTRVLVCFDGYGGSLRLRVVSEASMVVCEGSAGGFCIVAACEEYPRDASGTEGDGVGRSNLDLGFDYRESYNKYKRYYYL